MRALIQRVSEARVTVDGETVGEIGPGLLILICAMQGDGEAQADQLAAKIAKLRIFRDEADKMNRSVIDIGGEVLVVSQFTLYGDCSKGRRPGFDRAADPEQANELYELFLDRVAGLGVTTAHGRFAAMMQVHLVNDGPVTMLLDTEKTF